MPIAKAIKRWNAAAAAMFGYPATEALRQKLDLMIPEHLRNAHWRGFDAAMASGKTRLGEYSNSPRGLLADWASAWAAGNRQ